MSLRQRKINTDDEEIEIDFIKSDVILWPLNENDDDDEDKKESTFTQVTQELRKCASCNSLNVNYDNNSVCSKLSSVSSLDGPIADVYRKRRHGSNRFRTNNRTRIEPTILNHFLDLLSICFWKCSTGCQQLPDKQ